MIKIIELREKDEQALQLELTEQVKHMYTLRTQALTEKLEDPSQVKKTRRQIARIKTLINERKLAAQASK